MNPPPKNLDAGQIKDAGLALALIFFLLFRLGGKPVFFWPGIGALLVVMTAPSLLKPWAKLWFALSYYLSTFVSKIILSLVFFMVATPIGYIRRLAGFDAMRLKPWRDGKGSTFIVRRHTYSRKDLETPY